jgi:dienelactone hydrolase
VRTTDYLISRTRARLADLGPHMERNVRSHSRTLEEAKSYSRNLTLKNGMARQIECPPLLVMGKQDRLINWQDAQRLADETPDPSNSS